MSSGSGETAPLLSNRSVSNRTYVEDNDDISVVSSSSSSTENSAKAKMDDLVSKRLNGAHLFVILIGLWIGVFLSSLDSSIVATIYPEIGTQFKQSNQIIWVATAYMLSYTALQPLYGRISDAFGRKNALVFAALIFFIGSFFCGAANSLWTLVIARGVAGIGGGGLNTMSAVITSDLVSLRERGKFQGYANIAYGLGSVIGAPLGGFITDTIGWRYCFYINLPILLMTLYVSVGILTNYNLKEQEEESTLWERFKKIDYAGAITVVLSVVCFMLATSWGGNTKAWSDPLVIGTLSGSVVFAIAFCIIEAKVAKFPIMPWHIVSNRTAFASALTNLFGITCSYGTTFTTPLFFQGLLGYTPSQAGLFFIPKVIAMSAGSLTSGFYMSHTGEYRRYLLCASALALVSMICYSQWQPTTSYYFIIPTLMMDGFASGSIITSALIAMLSCVEQHEMATITSISYLFRSAGGVIGISATSAIFQGVVKHILSEKITGPDADKIIDIARKSMTDIRHLLPDDALEVVLGAYQTALKGSFFFCVVVSLLGFIACSFIKQNHLESKVRK
ncbi:major facilitator superfamily domain-containing protein [Zychaea mexicana]|uniref:major facilitator superfamily domain-containing protein n=1 Tax=Zychaea mexicana TaxID=64656 RepID=UPI0022FF1863|nr:major facilitator superfamily domain-containing protein [Zychaea mexicana]KAI9492154.1 major facilitator superfamily domain-containing protein [Zychaea mexicana]